MIKNLTDKLYSKLKKEYSNYVSEVKQLPVEEIIARSYELTIKQEFVETFYETNRFNKFQLLSLLEKEQPLQFLYDLWMDADSGIHNLLMEALDYNFDELGEDYENKIMLKIQKDKNYNLIKQISDSFQQRDFYDFCTDIKHRFNVDDLDEYDVYKILNSKDGGKYLYDFLDQVRYEKQVKYLLEVQALDSEKIKNIEDKILPELKNIIRQQDRNKERDSR